MFHARIITHRGKKRIAVEFENREELKARFRKLRGAQWSASLKVWHLPDTREYRQKFKLSELNDEAEKKALKFVQWLQSKRYSENTIKTYSDALRIFLGFFSTKPLQEINNEDIIHFNHEYILKNKLSASYQNQMVNAVKLFFSTIENIQLRPELIHRPKKSKILPNVLSKKRSKPFYPRIKTLNIVQCSHLSTAAVCAEANC